jgi:Reverse transcriptase (RNA-dependent DNA polymerase)
MKFWEWPSQFADHLAEAIKEAKWEDYTAKIKRRLPGSPWGLIPNCAELKINIGKPDQLLENFGLNKKTKAQIIITPHENGPSNRYIEHQIIRLNKIKKTNDKDRFFKIADILIKRSNTFRVLAFHKLCPNWHRHYPLNYIINVNRTVSDIINKNKTLVDYKRFYVEKGPEKWRPISAPNLAWRIVLQLKNNFLLQWLDGTWEEEMHGFIPGRGTLSCWKDLFLKGWHEEEEIWEWDFAQYFPSLKSTAIKEALRKANVSEDWVEWLEEINRTLPKMPEEIKIEEDRDQLKLRRYWNWGHEWKKFQKNLFKIGGAKFTYKNPNPRRMVLKTKPTELEPKATIKNNWYQHFKWYGETPTEYTMPQDPTKAELTEAAAIVSESGYNFLDLAKSKANEEEKTNPRRIATDYQGLAQGFPTSPTLANLIMKEIIQLLKKEGIRTIAYADDFITNKDIPIRIQQQLWWKFNARINYEKSGQLKSGEVWHKPLKFLGLTFDGENLQAKTRKGSELKLIGNIKNLALIVNWLEERELKQEDGYCPEIPLKDNWEEIMKSKFMGWIQNRLYSGTWNADEIKQNFELEYIPKSWTDKKIATIIKEREIDIFNLSSFACQSLEMIFRYNQKLRRRKGLPLRFVVTDSRPKQQKEGCRQA